MHSKEEQIEAFSSLLDIVWRLRRECPWDSKQTFDSVRTLTIEEVYELASAISKHDMAETCKELGDVLLHILLYARMGSEQEVFDLKDVCDRLSDKLIFRHPHIFGNVEAATAEDVSKLWEQVKLKEKGGNKSVLAGVPEALPALIKAQRIQDKAAHAGFDWEVKEQVWDKVREEMREVETEIHNGDQDRIEAEFGDLLFAVINAARLYDVNPDNALERTNRKFINRFTYLEEQSKADGKNLKDMTLDEMEKYWQDAKKQE